MLVALTSKFRISPYVLFRVLIMGVIPVLIFSCDDGETDGNRAGMTIGMDQNYLNADVPIFMAAQDQNSYLIKGNYVWHFGDGTQSTDFQRTTHTYDNPGDYTIVVEISNGSDKITISKQIHVHNAYVRYGVTNLSEKGHLIYRDKANQFRAFYTTPEQFRVLHLSNSLEPQSSMSLDFWWPHVTAGPVLNKNGNLIFLTGNFYEFDGDGSLVREVVSNNGKSNMVFHQILAQDDGYLLLGDSLNHVCIDNLNLAGQSQGITTFDIQRQGYQLVRSWINKSGTITIYFKMAGGEEPDDAIFVTVNLQGEILKEQVHHLYPVRNIISLPSGTIYAQSDSESKNEYYTFIDNEGNKDWSYSFSNATTVLSWWPRADLATAFEVDNNIYLFYGGFAGKKFDASGKLIWSKGFGYHRDQLGSVVMIENGGFVLFGTHNLDAPNGDLDLGIVEIDASGNVIERNN